MYRLDNNICADQMALLILVIEEPETVLVS